MTYRPYPDRVRALRQVERGRVTPPVRGMPACEELMAHWESEEFRQQMRRAGRTAAESIRGLHAALSHMPRLLPTAAPTTPLGAPVMDGGLKKCDKPDGFRQTKSHVGHCCVECADAAERRYEIGRHSATCDQRHAERGRCGRYGDLRPA